MLILKVRSNRPRWKYIGMDVEHHTPFLAAFCQVRMLFKGCVCYISASLFLTLKVSTCQTRKNVFYFTAKAVFIIEKS